jgi:hypothetical protein
VTASKRATDPDHPFRRVHGRSMTPRSGWAVVRESRFAGVSGWLVRWDDEARITWHRDDHLTFEDAETDGPPDPQRLADGLEELRVQHENRALELVATPAVVMARPWLEGVELATQPGVLLGNWGTEYGLVWFPGMCEGRLVTGISVQPIRLEKLSWTVQT